MRFTLATFLMLGMYGSAHAEPECYENVSVTGYYTPLLEDYDIRKTEKIQVNGLKSPRRYNASFLAFARIKEAGVAINGTILVFENGQWGIRTKPLTDAEKNWFPFEKDYVTTRTITTLEDGTRRTYPKAFVDIVGLEGSGKVTEGTYIGWPWDCAPTDGKIAYFSRQCDHKWHVYPVSPDATGKKITLGVVATDKKYFDPTNPWVVTISPVPAGFTSGVFAARDLGPAIVDARIDVFSGSGLKGLKRTMTLTNNDSRVCFEQISQEGKTTE